MSRLTVNSKCRLCKSEGIKLFLKGSRCLSPKCPIDKKGAVRPGMHGLKNSSKPTDYGIQLRAKQKAKRIYGVNETQFRNYFDNAKNLKGKLGDNLIILLERRLDNVLYKSGLACSRSQAKQFISHKNILINGKALNIASYSVKADDLIILSPSLAKQFKDLLPTCDKDFKAPSWLTVNSTDYSVKITSIPTEAEENTSFDINLIIEYYSR